MDKQKIMSARICWEVLIILSVKVIQTKSQNGTVAHVCEFQEKDIGCGLDKTIYITNAFYGRLSTEICTNEHLEASSHMGTLTTDCRTDTPFEILKNRCEGKQTCSLEASNGLYGDPCDSVHKYLEVEFQCLERQVTTTSSDTSVDDGFQKSVTLHEISSKKLNTAPSSYTTLTSTARFLSSSGTIDVLNTMFKSTTRSIANLPEVTKNLQQTTDSKACFCFCTFVRYFENMTTIEKEEYLKNSVALLEKKLTVEKNNLSSYRRRKSSATDSRRSSEIIGWFGVLMCAIPVVLVITFDVMTFCK